MSSKCTAAKAYDILGIYDFPDNLMLSTACTTTSIQTAIWLSKRLPVKNMTLPAIS